MIMIRALKTDNNPQADKDEKKDLRNKKGVIERVHIFMYLPFYEMHISTITFVPALPLCVARPITHPQNHRMMQE